jgi:hypothetical protein
VLSSTLDAVEIGCDNQGALKLLETGVVQAKAKHIDVKYHHTRDEVQKKTVRFYYVPSAENPSDILTKALSLMKHIDVGCLGKGEVNLGSKGYAAE